MCKGQSSSQQQQPPTIPTIAQWWRNVYLKVPKLNFPGTRLSVSFTLVSALLLLSIRLVATQVLVQVFGWPKGDVSDGAAASVAGVVHSSLLCPGLMVAFLSHKYSPSEHLSKAAGWWQELVDALLQFCTGYMVYDASFILARCVRDATVTPDDFLFLGHHFMTTTYMTQTRVYQAGHMSAMMCMLLGEASNPVMNSWFVTSRAITLDCCNGPLMQIVHQYMEYAFAIIYLLFRVALGPLVCSHMSWDLLCSKNAKENLPLALRLFWNFMIWAVILGSYSWIVFTFELLLKHRGIVKEGEGEL